jgi:phosphatidylinositol glycan class U
MLAVMRYTFFTVATLLYATLLGPAFYYLWIYAGSGNANFFYAITLVWSLGLSLLVADSLFAVLRDEWEVQRPEMKGKDTRQI